LEERDFVVIGSGPAGLSAATTAAQAGVEVTVIGEDPRIGGQIFRQIIPPLQFQEKVIDTQDQKIFERLEDDWAKSNIQFFNEAVAWGMFDDKVIAFNNPKYSLLRAKRLLISEGAYETPVAFPGWTLPGIMTLGAAQTLLKGQGVVPEGKIVVAGTGPLLYYTASQLLKNGAYVKAIIEASSFSQVTSWTRRLWRAPGILGKGLKYLATIKKHRVPIYYSSMVKEARGNEVLDEVVYVRVNHLWKPKAGTEQKMEVDILCLNFGFTPSTQFSHMARCGHVCDPQLRGWTPIFNSRYETTQPGIFIAGDAAGIGGVKLAVIQGRVAGTEIARQLGAIKDGEAAKSLGRLEKSLASHRWYQKFLKKIYAFRPGLLDLLTGETLLCRCEEVNYKSVSDAIEEGARHIEQIKRLTRIGMGRCQGRFCYPTLVGLLSRVLEPDELEREDFSARLPVKPLPLGVLFEMPC
jgi:NADPH-dependent 2,4-dienoyl-CoA reductase/sulfur reductase-like enzyme